MSGLGALLLIVRRSLRQHALSTSVTVLSAALASGPWPVGSSWLAAATQQYVIIFIIVIIMIFVIVRIILVIIIIFV